MSPLPFHFRRPVRFDEIDAAGLVYFPRIVGFAHEALERLVESHLPGRYRRLLNDERVGLPCVHVSSDFSAPLAFGDEVDVATTVTKVGNTSVSFSVDITRASTGTLCARLVYVVVCVDLEGVRKRSLPADLRDAFAHHEQQAETPELPT